MSTMAVPAAADATLLASEPRNREVTTRPPGAVTLAFGHSIDPAVARIFVFDSAGRNVTLGTVLVEFTNASVQLRPGLPEGTYTVMYRINGVKSGVRGGAYQFAFGKADWTKLDKATWVGKAEQPVIFAEENPNEPSPVPSRTPSPTAPASSTPAAPSSSAPPASPTADPATASPEPGPPVEPTATAGSVPWLIGGIVLAVAGAIGVIAWRRGSSPS
jgi:methionine-rich copper-binding protein CopC